MINMYNSKSTSNAIKWFRALILAILFLGGIQESKASHLAGADLTYESLGNGTYLVTYTFYRDCFGITAPTQAFLSVESASCGQPLQSITMDLVPGTGQEITPTCSTTVSTCNGGTAAGIQQYQYTALVSLPQGCPDWHLWVSDCCRNQAITTLQNGAGEGLYIEAYLNNTTTENSSPTFNNVPIVFFCIGQTNYFNHGAVDADGDSLVYYFITPRNAANDPVLYNPGYSISNPVSSSPAASINAFTGDIAITPTQAEIGVVSVLVEEYRNGVLIGRVMRDIQVYTVACSNTLPSLSGVNGGAAYTTSACIGGAPLCFNINSSDGNSTDSLYLTWNNGIPGATFNPGTGPRPVGQFCWAPTPADARPNPYTFTVTVHDNSCPSPGVQTYSFSVLVSALNVSVTSSPTVRCHGEATGTASASATGIGPFTYLWMPGQYTTASVSNLPAGNYTVDIVDGTGCAGSRNFTITEPPALTLSLSSTNAQCSGGPGTATAVVGGGTTSYTYSWNTSPTQTTSTISNLVPGNYTVTVLDANLCRIRGSVTVSGSNPVIGTLNLRPTTCGASNGSINVSVSNSTGPLSYVWTPNVSTSFSATGLAAGSYDVTVTDSLGCSTTLNGIVPSSVAVAASASATASSCSVNNGTVNVTVSSGIAPFTYSWTPNVSTSSSATGLAAGNYAITVSDSAGCSANVTATVNGSSPIAASLNITPASCAANDGAIDVIVTSGTAPYTYDWNPNVSTSSSATGLTVGMYSVTVSDNTGCSISLTGTVNSSGITASVSSSTNATCSNSEDGSATVVASGGLAPYSYLWMPNGDTTQTVNTLAVGSYSILVTDYLGCSTYAFVTIGSSNTAPTVDLGPDSNACIGSTVTLDAGAGTGLSYLWSDNSTGQTLTVSTAGTYSVLVSDGNGCQNFDAVTVNFINCMNNPNNQSSTSNTSNQAFGVYPNPAHDRVEVSIAKIHDVNVRITILDLIGNRIFSSNEVAAYNYSRSIDLTQYPSGIYMLKVEYGNESKAIRLIKE